MRRITQYIQSPKGVGRTIADFSHYPNPLFPSPPTILFLLSFVFYLLSFFSCSSPTKSEGITISGRVVLEDTTDYSGVTVSLYKPVELDTALVRINQEYPNIGVPISQETEFDHREHTPVYTTTTDKNGNWKIENIEKGIYNIVFFVEGYGWFYIYEENINKTNIIKNINLKILSLDGILMNDVVLNSNSIIFIKNNVIVPNNRQLVFNNKSFVFFDSNKKLTIEGKLILNSKTIFTSYGENYGRGVELISDNLDISNSNFTYLNFALNIKNNKTKIRNCFFSNNNMDIYISNAQEIYIENNIFTKNKAINIQSIESNINVMNNIFYSNETLGVDGKNSSGLISYNYWQGYNEAAIAINYGGYAYTRSFFDIYFNDFYDNTTNIKMANNGYINSNNNNFINFNDFSVYCGMGYSNLRDTLNFQNNYWGLTDSLKIALAIFDRMDKSDGSNLIIDYSGYRLSKIKWN